MKRRILSLIFLILISGFCVVRPVYAEGETGSPGWMRLVLINISTYTLYQDIQMNLKETGLLSQIVPRVATKDLYEFDVMCSVSPEALVQALQARLIDTATVDYKRLPIGISEISISAISLK